jgi:hypothetical protein
MLAIEEDYYTNYIVLDINDIVYVIMDAYYNEIIIFRLYLLACWRKKQPCYSKK